MNSSALDNKLKQNVLIITFFKRSSKPVGEFRRMICTKCDKILSSANGQMTLGFWRPHGKPKINFKDYNLSVVWDILKRDYRLVPAESVTIVKAIEPENWWKYYDETVKPLSQSSKDKFMYKP